MGAKTSRIEIGTTVIDMRYKDPLYMIEDAARIVIAQGLLRQSLETILSDQFNPEKNSIVTACIAKDAQKRIAAFLA